jgi:predicted GIY-YIG superfamily endonuclease
MEYYLYILESDGFYKIGITNSVERRIKDMSCGNPHEVRLVSKYTLKSKIFAFSVEQRFHKFLRPLNKRNEWYRLDSYLISILQDCFHAISENNLQGLMEHGAKIKDYITVIAETEGAE